MPASLAPLRDAGQLGYLYESWVVSELIKAIDYESLHHDLFTWHTQDQAEVDLLLRTGRGYIPIEIKYKRKLARRDLSGLRAWLEVHQHETLASYIVYPGRELQEIAPGIWAIPDHYLFGLT